MALKSEGWEGRGEGGGGGEGTRIREEMGLTGRQQRHLPHSIAAATVKMVQMAPT